jgi:hypothetical protein
MVLTRQEREELLLNWGVSFDDIIDAIRTNIRVKNQRRQTVTNLGKADRFEEALENATRRIKRAFLLRRSTAGMLMKRHEQAHVASRVHSPSSSVSDDHNPNEEQVAGISSKEALVKIEINREILLPNFQQTIPSDMELMQSVSFRSDIDDIHTTFSGFSFGESTTASAKEMERFYQELELELFGDFPLPDMVGETLEVPGVIPEDERVYDDLLTSERYSEPPSVAPSFDESAADEGMDSRDIDMSRLRGQSSKAPRPTTSEGNLLFHDDPLTFIRMGHALPPNIRMSSDRDPSGDFGSVEKHRSDRARAYLSETVTAMEQRYLHPSLIPPLTPPSRGTGRSLYDETLQTAQGYSRSSRSQDGSGTRSRRVERRSDCPLVCHIPLYSRRSLTHWMEGHDDSVVFPMNPPQHELVVITEDPRWDDRIIPSSSSGSGASPSSVFAPTLIPASFCYR